MRRIISGRAYDTETAEEVLYQESRYYAPGDLKWYEEYLYRKRNGEYFLVGYGNAGSKYNEPCRSGGWCAGEALIPLSDSEARDWAMDNVPAREFEEVFGEVSEDGGFVMEVGSLSRD